MLSATKKLIKRWEKAPTETVVNVLDASDKQSGHYVRVLMIQNYTPVIVAGYLDKLDALVTAEGATLRKTIRYASSGVTWNQSMKNKLKRLNKSIDSTPPDDPVRKAEVQARDTIIALRDAKSDDNRKLIDVHTFLTIMAPKKHQLHAVQAKLERWFDDKDGTLNALEYEQMEALKQTGPAHDMHTPAGEFFEKHHYGQVTTDTVAARTYPMTRGSSSDGQGVYFGQRTEDGSFTFKNICDPDDPRAQNITVFGKSGEGKSYFLKALVVSLLEEGIYVFVFDLDGEWRDLCAYVGGTYIDHTSDQGRYFEPLTIMAALPELDLDCVEFNRNRYKKAMDNGVRTFSLLADGLTKEQLFECGEAIERVMKQAGIDEKNPSTWNAPFKGERPTIHLAFREIEKAAAEGNTDADSLYKAVRIYFIGIYKGIFSMEEKIEFESKKTRLTVYKVGGGQTSKDDKNELAKQAQLKMSMSFEVVNSNIQWLKFEGVRFSAVVVDEGQRQTKNPEMRREIFDWYTAIRKWNGMMILGSNTPAIMLDTAEGEGMWENTSVRVYFYMERSAIRKLANHSSVPLEIQERISENEGTNRYVLEYHKKFDELLMTVPAEESRLYKTRGLKQVG
ncbi:DUF87 domain-containing protein [Paenibacillus algorifonticola]|uniref:TraG/VirB4 family ATPase n=1 Tax=Paenibacillus algorifonticola TaxID=684063 RepID=UPI003D265188